MLARNSFSVAKTRAPDGVASVPRGCFVGVINTPSVVSVACMARFIAKEDEKSPDDLDGLFTGALDAMGVFVPATGVASPESTKEAIEEEGV